jgi:hypothetical protein
MREELLDLWLRKKNLGGPQDVFINVLRAVLIPTNEACFVDIACMYCFVDMSFEDYMAVTFILCVPTYQSKRFQCRRQYELLPATGSFCYRFSEDGSFIAWKTRIRRDIP